MARTTSEPDDAADELSEDDVIGHLIVNPENPIHLGVPVDVKTIRNLRGDEKRVFVCDNGEHAASASDELDRFVNRDVEKVLRQVREYGYELVDPVDHFDDVDASMYDLPADEIGGDA